MFTLVPAIVQNSTLNPPQVRKKLVYNVRPNPQPLPYKGSGARIKASLPVGERFGEGFQE